MKCIINNKEVEINVNPAMRLIDFLRNELNLTGTKEGCSEGECGACTIIVDNVAVTSCIMLVGSIENKEVITIEGLAQNGELDIIQKTFVENGAIQCGFCTPGMIMSVKALLLQNSNPNEDEVRKAISGNLCRCTGYQNIVDAVLKITGDKNELS